MRSVEDKRFLAEVFDGLPVAATGRGEGGRFLAGHQLGGRPRAFDFRAIVTKWAKENNEPVEDALARVYLALLRNAVGGDVPASKLLIERLCGKEADVLDVAVAARPMSDIERAARIESILRAGRGETE